MKPRYRRKFRRGVKKFRRQFKKKYGYGNRKSKWSNQDVLHSKCYLTSGVVVQGTTNNADYMVAWSTNYTSPAGTTVLMNIDDSLEFSKNRARYRYYKISYVKIGFFQSKPLYEFDTARIGGIVGLFTGSSPVSADLDSTSPQEQFEQLKDYKSYSPRAWSISKKASVAKYYRKLGFGPKVLTADAYPAPMYSALRIRGDNLGSNAFAAGSISVCWYVTFYDRVPEYA